MRDDAPRRLAADLLDSVRLALMDLDRLVERTGGARARVAEPADPLDVYGAGALLHGYYTHLERLLARIERDLDHAPLEGPDWHRRLLRAMTLDRPGVRPQVLSTQLVDQLDPLLGATGSGPYTLIATTPSLADRHDTPAGNMRLLRQSPDGAAQWCAGMLPTHGSTGPQPPPNEPAFCRRPNGPARCRRSDHARRPRL